MNVIDIAHQYDAISNLFDTSRVRIWNNVKKFITDMKDVSENKKMLLDAGCGNGKNSLYAMERNYEVIGIDISEKLLNISISKGINVKKMDLLNIDFIDTFDKCICIAVIHHINSIELQCKAIINMIRSLKQYGELLISVWSLEKVNTISFISTGLIEHHDNDNKKDYRDFTQGHNFVDWIVNKKNNEIVKRYYYIHNYDTFVNLMELVKDHIQIDYEISWEKQNWFCKIIKL